MEVIVLACGIFCVMKSVEELPKKTEGSKTVEKRSRRNLIYIYTPGF
jgi:hypothetical protein